ncbi:hypothetical protein E2C01_088713 [Portunus trituberculatus]|uniref:Uncharacterized protein n=1 Tax=Portunus trituberculatus TaxID=210409 RepID=A0A5B7JA16_PORTR|nr:hypothetical protein [Portunus trituberculatus]
MQIEHSRDLMARRYTTSSPSSGSANTGETCSFPCVLVSREQWKGMRSSPPSSVLGVKGEEKQSTKDSHFTQTKRKKNINFRTSVERWKDGGTIVVFVSPLVRDSVRGRYGSREQQAAWWDRCVCEDDEGTGEAHFLHGCDPLADNQHS